MEKPREENHELEHSPRHGHGHGHADGCGRKHSHAASNEDSDAWTKLSALGELVTSLISDTYWIASLFELVIGNGHEDNAVSLSWTAVGLGVGFAVFTAAGATYSHWHLNKRNQHFHSNGQAYQVLDDATDQHKLSRMQYFALACDWVSHTGDVAGPIAFVVDLMTKGQLPVEQKAIVYGTATLFGGLASYADVRTCRMHMKPADKKESVAMNKR